MNKKVASMNKKVALITGANGQDASYLAEYLIEKGYEVHGTVRRNSVPESQTTRIDHIFNKIKLHYMDLTDPMSVNEIVNKIKPDELYHLAAQSHVQISFDLPKYTLDVNAGGTLAILEAVHRFSPRTKIYHAATSEMFGNQSEPDGFQREETKMIPVSPYGCSKLYAHSLVQNYRNSYGIFAVSGVLFNHETVAEFMPMFCKLTGSKEFDIKPISEIIEFDRTKTEYQSKDIDNIQVWGKDGWINVKHASAYPHDKNNDNKYPKFINGRNYSYMATGSHVAFMDDGSEKETKDIKCGDKLEKIKLPKGNANKKISIFEAELIGLIVGDGCISYTKKGNGIHSKFTNSNEVIRNHFNNLWSTVTGGYTVYYPSRSGFNKDKIVGQLVLNGGADWLRSIDIYTKDKKKRIPRAILNSDAEIQLAFLRGYNMADGLKESPCTYEFRNFKTNSATLAMGLIYLINRTTGQQFNINIDYRKRDNHLFYSINILSDKDKKYKDNSEVVLNLLSEGLSAHEIHRRTGIQRLAIRRIKNGNIEIKNGGHLKKDSAEVKNIIDLSNYDGWFYDLETSSGEFHCGIGDGHVHNSPRRGINFVTNKVALGAVKIKRGLETKLRLGTLDSCRDWGHARDYVKAMHLMLQNVEPKDYVIATGKSRSVKDLVKCVFEILDMDWEQYVVNDQKYERPEELWQLKGDPTRANTELGWKSEITFDVMLKEMVDHWMNEIK